MFSYFFNKEPEEYEYTRQDLNIIHTLQDIYGNIGQQRGAAMEDLYRQLDDYSKLISQQQGG